MQKLGASDYIGGIWKAKGDESSCNGWLSCKLLAEDYCGYWEVQEVSGQMIGREIC